MIPKAGASAISTRQTSADDRIRVMLVDDSAIIRGFITRVLVPENDIEVVASVGNGEIAVNRLATVDVDVIILDIEMPVMDGLTALPLLLKAKADVRIIMASTLTLRNADISMEALKLGASDYIPKPTSRTGGDKEFNQALVSKVRALGTAVRLKSGLKTVSQGGAVEKTSLPTKSLYKNPIKLAAKKTDPQKPDALVIGSSTGGPEALLQVLEKLPHRLPYPVFITQHMPVTFTKLLADKIMESCSTPCHEAEDGEIIQPGTIYVAPGDYHMTVITKGVNKVISLNQDAPESFCRPAVDPMLRSLGATYHGRTLTVILTGMGQDGSKGSEIMVRAGGTVIAQDEASSVVWGMPGAVATAGVCSAVLPLQEIAGYINKFMVRGTA